MNDFYLPMCDLRAAAELSIARMREVERDLRDTPKAQKAVAALTVLSDLLERSVTRANETEKAAVREMIDRAFLNAMEAV